MKKLQYYNFIYHNAKGDSWTCYGHVRETWVE